MDFPLSNLKSKTFMLVAFFLMLCTTCKGLQCDVEKQYQLVQNKTSTEILKCPKCRPCKAGYELQPPCGTVVLPTDSLRICKPCKDGFYSANEDMLPCQLCQSKTCFAHQIVVGVCKKDEPDTSHCAGTCKEGYIMNSDGTACEVDKPEITTNLPTITTNSPTLSNKTDGKTGLSSAKTELSVAEIILIVICLLIPVVGLCFCIKHRNLILTQCQRDKDVESTLATNNTTLDETEDEQNETIIVQEKDHCNGLPTSDKPHIEETTAGFVDSKQSNNVENKVSDAVTGNSRSAMSPEPVMQNRQEEPFIQQPASAVMVQNSCPVNNPLLARFGDLSVQIYIEICDTFDGGAPGNDWRALAGWLGLKVGDVNKIEKTSEVIKRWAVATENTVARFVQILEVNGMTHLADQIKLDLNKRL